MSFANPWLLLTLLLVPLVLWLRRSRARQASLPFGNFAILASVSPGWRARAAHALPWLEAAALTLLCLALARPQVESHEVLTGEGVDILVALDMSGSMNAVDRTQDEIAASHAAGVEPQNRFEVAREVLKSFVATRREDRIGLVVFGLDAFLKFPLTLDYVRIMESLDGLVLDDGVRHGDEECRNSCTISGVATAIGDALARAYGRLKDGASRSKNIILITDGANNRSTIDPLTMAQYLADQPEGRRARVFTILVGSGGNTKVPLRDPLTGGIARGRDGMQVYDVPDQPFPTDPELLKQIASTTGGRYFESYDEGRFREAFESLERTEFTVKTAPRQNDRFQVPLWAALALLALRALAGWTLLRRHPA
jgi:Ca-activated chloride channel family protein